MGEAQVLGGLSVQGAGNNLEYKKNIIGVLTRIGTSVFCCSDFLFRASPPDPL